MARIRTIKPAFFMDESLGDISFAARLTFIGMWTLADKEGRLEDRPRFIKASLFPYDDVDIDVLLAELETKPFMTRYSVGGKKYIQINSFTKHQKPHTSEVPSVIPPPDVKTADSAHAAKREISPGNVENPPDGGDSTNGGEEKSQELDLDLDLGSGSGKELKRSTSFAGIDAQKPLRSPPSETPEAYVERVQGFFRLARDGDLSGWREAFPAVDLLPEMARAREWLISNPKQRKTDLRRFLVNWLGRTQSRARPGRDPTAVIRNPFPVGSADYLEFEQLAAAEMRRGGGTRDPC